MEIALVLLLDRIHPLLRHGRNGNVTFGIPNYVGSFDNGACVGLRVFHFALPVFSNFGNNAVVAVATFAGAYGVVQIALRKKSRFTILGNGDGFLLPETVILLKRFSN